jgi:hypothetical protein
MTNSPAIHSYRFEAVVPAHLGLPCRVDSLENGSWTGGNKTMPAFAGGVSS